MNRSLRTVAPCHPGEILFNLYMEPLSLTITELANRLGTSRKTLSAIINGRTSISVDMALRLAKAFNTSPESWLNAQMNLDIWKAQQGNQIWKNIEPFETSECPVSESV